MEESILVIKPGIGIGDVLFGMTRKQVLETMGEPTEKEVLNYDEGEEGGVDEVWHYDELELSVSFEEDLGWTVFGISATGGQCRLEETPIIGLTKDGLNAVLNDMDFGDLEYEDHSSLENPSQELIASALFGINFWLENGKVSEVQLNPMPMAEGDLDWSE